MMQTLILLCVMGTYGLFTWMGWHAGERLARYPQWQHRLLLFTCGIWLELVFFDLLPSAQQTFLGSWGFVRGNLFSIILFFSPIFVMGIMTTLAKRRDAQVDWRWRVALFMLQNMMESIIIYVLYRTNMTVGILYILLTAPHALAEVMSLRYIVMQQTSARLRPLCWSLIAANYIGLGVGFVLVTCVGSLMGLAVLHTLFAGYLFFTCITELYQHVVLAKGEPTVPYALFAGMLAMTVLNVIV